MEYYKYERSMLYDLYIRTDWSEGEIQSERYTFGRTSAARDLGG